MPQPAAATMEGRARGAQAFCSTENAQHSELHTLHERMRCDGVCVVVCGLRGCAVVVGRHAVFVSAAPLTFLPSFSISLRRPQDVVEHV